MKTTCPLCQAQTFTDVLSRNRVPVIQNRVYASALEARNAPTASLRIVCCRRCGFMFNRAFDETRITYDTSYDNDQTLSKVFVDHMSAMADRVRAACSNTPGQILEIGCGQGAFLSLLQTKLPDRSAIGFDPSWRGNDLNVQRSYFNEETSKQVDGPISVVVTRHVIEHVPDPVKFLSVIRKSLPTNFSGSLFIETPCARWIVDNLAMHDFFYEHVNYATTKTLALACYRAGFRSTKVSHVFGGQYLWAEARIGDDNGDVETLFDREFHDTAAAAAIGLQDVFAKYQRLFASSPQNGVAVWGAGAKGVTFASTVDPHAQSIRCIIDINPKKQGYYIGATGHQVVDLDGAQALGVDTVILMNPNYQAEIAESLRAAGLGWPIRVV
jgi:SAM-dependent methyltransferase